MHHFVVKFQKKIRLRRQGGIDPPNQNLADVPGKSTERRGILRKYNCTKEFVRTLGRLAAINARLRELLRRTNSGTAAENS